MPHGGRNNSLALMIQEAEQYNSGELPVSLAGDNDVALAGSCLIPEVYPADVGLGPRGISVDGRRRRFCPVFDGGEK